MAVQPREIEIKLPSVNIAGLHYFKKKNEKNLPIIALHGWLDNANSFAGLAPAITANHNLVALDIPGHGKSGHYGPGHFYHFIDYVNILYQVLEKQGIERCILLGHSMGGGISSLFAGAFPDRVEKLVLIEALGPLHALPRQAPLSIARGITQLEAALSKPVKGFSNLETGIKLRQKAGGLSYHAARTLVERGVYLKKNRYYWRRDARLNVASPLRMTVGQVNAFLKKIRAETLLIVGDINYKYLKEKTGKRLNYIKGLALKKLPGNHHLHLENPAVVATEINRFLAG